MSAANNIRLIMRTAIFIVVMLFASFVFAQPIQNCLIKDGKMFIMLDRKLTDKELTDFIDKYDLKGIGLWQLIKTKKEDSLNGEGWKVVEMNEVAFIISKPLQGVDNFDNPVNKILLMQKEQDFATRFPAVSSNIVLGYNRFRRKQPFAEVKDSVVEFYLRGSANSANVYLAGSFNGWSPTALPMKQTDSGWIAYVKIGPGKYWYKFVADGNWIIDSDNDLRESDGLGNVNSVFFKTNKLFALNGFTNAKNVFLSGSFNAWKEKDLRMMKTATGWQLPLYLANGTHAYKFIVDGKWYADESNDKKIPDGAGGFNSMLSIGKPYLFQLRGFENAKQVMLAGSFNNWRDFELPMMKTTTGWELPYVIGPGNYEYKFIVDGKWTSDPANVLTPNKESNSFLIIEPNHTFRLKEYGEAKRIFLAGDFNNWSPEAYPMKRVGDEWIFQLNLPVGKTRYKFIVDGKWILDPANKLWEQNEWETGNSIIWIDNKEP